jgi:plastocyanin
MRSYGLALAVGAFVLGACAGKDKAANDTTAAATGRNDSAATSAAPAATPTPTGSTATPGAAAGAAGAVGAAKPATGATHRVQMLLQGTAYKFVPADLTVKQGDEIDYVNVSGGPHNICFNSPDVPADVQTQLDANMPTMGTMPKLGKACSPLVTEPNAVYKISFAGIKPGKYAYFCTPHQALGMKGSVTIQ